ncbi:MAG: patatin-like phospholipase family protein, partial [Acidobacteria bacterium]|nr:patatin-like phospholipase family protein [Acidobacteriota bacterium]
MCRGTERSRSRLRGNPETTAMTHPPESACLTSAEVRAIEAQRIGRAPQVGLAISGGGIRSATFALGLVQALQRHGLFASLDYVSTVSGGGYLGAWLHALQRRGQRDPALTLDANEPRQVRFLRAYSNYLTPQLGLFSGDTWAAVGTVTRNLVITFTLLSLSLLAVLCVPWAIHRTYQTWIDIAVAGGADVDRLLSVAFVLMVVAFATSASNMARPLSDGTWESDTRDWTPPWRVQMQVVVPILVAMAILAAIVDRLPVPPPLPEFPSAWERLAQYESLMWAGGGFALVWATGLAVAHLSKMLATGFSAASGPMATDWRTALRAWLQLTAFAWPAGIIGAAVGVWSTAPLVWTPFVELRMPLLVLAFLLAVTAHIALAGTLLSEETREWWARVAGQVLLGTAMLSVLVFISVYAPDLIDRYTAELDPYGASKKALALLWAAVTGSGIVAGRSRRTSDGTGTSWMERIGRIAPIVFVAGYLLILAVVIVAIHQPCNALEAIGGVAAFGTLAFALSRRADLNEFSLHALYRNRLVRCYLGASNTRRQAHPFHGFDPNDDLRLDLSAEPAAARCRPYPLFNAAINLVGGGNLAWQQRKAASFVFTPDVCGYEYRVDEQIDRGTAPAAGAAPPCSPTLSAYSRTAEHGSGPLTVGLAMATSGAAASPNMGYHTSPTLAFLMTVFNVRLGWWLRNPRYKVSWTVSHKRLSLVELVSELLGLTTAERDFVYLSDGGHFENLGVYELVRRRVPFIIV